MTEASLGPQLNTYSAKMFVLTNQPVTTLPMMPSARVVTTNASILMALAILCWTVSPGVLAVAKNSCIEVW